MCYYVCVCGLNLVFLLPGKAERLKARAATYHLWQRVFCVLMNDVSYVFDYFCFYMCVGLVGTLWGVVS